jgi:hypothetical protein
MIRRDIINRFLDGKRYCEDYLLWLQIRMGGHACYFSGLPLAFLFKPEYGEGGLSRNLWLMERGELEAYIRIYREGAIRAPTLVALYGLSVAKFFRRVVKVLIRKARRPQ